MATEVYLWGVILGFALGALVGAGMFWVALWIDEWRLHRKVREDYRKRLEALIAIHHESHRLNALPEREEPAPEQNWQNRDR